MLTFFGVVVSAIILMALAQFIGILGYFVMIAVLIGDFDSPIAHAIGYTMAAMVLCLAFVD